MPCCWRKAAPAWSAQCMPLRRMRPRSIREPCASRRCWSFSPTWFGRTLSLSVPRALIAKASETLIHVLFSCRYLSRPSISCARRSSSDTSCSRASRRYSRGWFHWQSPKYLMSEYTWPDDCESCLLPSPSTDRSGARSAADSAIRSPRAGFPGRPGGELPGAVPHGAGGLFRRCARRVC